jgi:hypothetical protein
MGTLMADAVKAKAVASFINPALLTRRSSHS